MTHAIVMAGGSGTRFWPRSRKNKPKQLLPLWDEKTLLEHTVARCKKINGLDNIWVVTAEHLVDPSRQAVGKLNSEKITFLGEPTARNTAPCILWGIIEAMKVDANATVVVLPADSYVGNEDRFVESIHTAVRVCEAKQAFVTLGITPSHAETGYGYVKVGRRIEDGVFLVDQFVEKPDLPTAEKYVAAKQYLWNAGMFVFPAKVGLEAFTKLMPELSHLFEGRSPQQAYAEIASRDAISFDYGIMERANRAGFSVVVVAADCEWNDVGSFSALESIGRATMGDVVSLECDGNVVQTDTGVIALLGIKDLVVVRDGDVVMVAPKNRSQEIKKLLEATKAAFPAVE